MKSNILRVKKPLHCDEGAFQLHVKPFLQMIEKNIYRSMAL